MTFFQDLWWIFLALGSPNKCTEFHEELTKNIGTFLEYGMGCHVITYKGLYNIDLSIMQENCDHLRTLSMHHAPLRADL